MKEIKVQKVIPEHTIEVTEYACENCDSPITDARCVIKCEKCGKEICSHCYEIVYTFEKQPLTYWEPEFNRGPEIHVELDIAEGEYESGYQDHLEMERVTYLCKDCAKKLTNKKKEQYLEDVQKAIDEYNRLMLMAYDKYIGGQ